MDINYWNEYGQLKRVVLAFPNVNSTNDNELFISQPDLHRVHWELRMYRGLLQRLGVSVLSFTYNHHPNQIFLRDLALVLGDRIMMGLPKHPTRNGEQRVLHEVLKEHYPNAHIQTTPTDAVSFEPADVLITGPKKITISVGNRTAVQALQYITQFAAAAGFTEVEVVHALPEGVPQHLLGHKHIVSATRMLSRVELKDEDLGLEVVELVESEEVVNKFAMNVVTLAPNEIIIPSMSTPRIQQYYEARGIVCHDTPMSEIHKMGGGLACITLPLVRD